ncbi:MAG: futalosine hydrolase [Desulfobacteraceae bacterium]|nr:futalosine hydrolase [Desulfobacteraceae bacterium]
MKSDILLVAATRNEISDLLNISKINSEVVSCSNKTIIGANLNNINYDLLITDPSVINTAHALTVALEKNKPRIIIQAGIAGIFKKSKLNIGDIAIASEARYIHTGVESSSYYATPDMLPFNLIDKAPLSKSGAYTPDSNYADKANQILLKSDFSDDYSILKGTIITVSTITTTQKTTDHIYNTYSPLMEAMEGAASAHVASLYDIPFLEIRSGSNFVGERDKKKWDIPLASKRISRACGAIIENIL